MRLTRSLRQTSILGVALIGCGASGTAALAPGAQPSAATETQSANGTASASSTVPAVQPRTAAAESLPAALPSLGELVIGTAHPVLLRAASLTGSWVVLCQAREDSDRDGKIKVTVEEHGELSGDRLQTYWVRGGGPGERIDRFLAQSPDGRFVAVQRSGRALLIDTATSGLIDLSERGADLRDDQSPYLGPRSVRFDPTGRRVLYLRSQTGSEAANADRVVVRELLSGIERVIDPGAGLLWRADFDSTGESVILKVITDDTNKNKRLDWPFPLRRELDAGCTGPVPTFTVWEFPGDQAKTRIAPLARSTVYEAPGFIATLGSGWLQRDGKLRIVWQSPETASVLTTEDCNARLLHSDPVKQLLVAACLDAKQGPTVELIGPGLRRSLNLQVSPFEVDIELERRPILVPLYTKQGTALLDLDSRTSSMLGESDWVIASYGKRALVRRGETLSLFNDGKLSPIPGKANIMAQSLRAGALALVPPVMVDLETGTTLGQIPGRALALSSVGAALVAADQPSEPNRLATGPLRWVLPSQAP
jgi:hypothetical protein